MYRNHRIALVIPARNEERLIGPTLDRAPRLLDQVIVVDDGSKDGQNEVIRKRAEKDPRIVLVVHTVNQGPGGAIITGYKTASELGCDIAVVVGGDNQMPLDEMERFLDPIINKQVDYTKGNRFSLAHLEQTITKMPRLRFFANWLITAMTKIFSGYYEVVDVVDGYTAISRRAIDAVDWSKAWKRYGYPMDFLIRLNAYGFGVRDISRTAIYTPGERQSQINGMRYAISVLPMMVKGFFWRLKFKYAYRDFHPLIMFYYGSLVSLTVGMLGGGYLVCNRFFSDGNQVTGSKSILVALLLLIGTQFLAFAMLLDREESKASNIDNAALEQAIPMRSSFTAETGSHATANA